jgi:short-chain fatty acids transporter
MWGAVMHAGKEPDEPRIARLSNLFVDTADRWFPDAYVFVLAGVALVGLAAVLHGASPLSVCRAFGDGFWTLIPFTAQMAYVAIGGYIVATSPAAAKILRWLARRPAGGRSAVVFVGVLSIGLSLLNWGLSLIFSGLLVREMARRRELILDYRAASAAAYLGLGCGFTLGLSSSAAQLQANPASIPSNLMPITGVIGFSQTIFTWQNAFAVVVLTLVSALVCYLTAPTGRFVRTAEDLGVNLGTGPNPREDVQRRPGDYLANSPVLSVLIVVLGLGWICMTFSQGNPILLLSGLNTYNLVFLLLGILLHGTPRSLADAFSRAVPSISGVLLQFPFYAAMAQMLTGPRNAASLSLSDSIAAIFINASADQTTFSIVVAFYSALLGLFIPSAGGKWIIEAPYVAAAANATQAHLGWTLMVYNLAETLPNFVNPFWMLPLLGIVGLKAKDIVGFTVLQFVVHFPVTLLLGSVLMSTFTYMPPSNA